MFVQFKEKTVSNTASELLKSKIVTDMGESSLIPMFPHYECI